MTSRCIQERRSRRVSGGPPGYIICVLLLLHPCWTFAQSLEVPLAVKIQFMEDFISASDAHWSVRDEFFVADFLHHSHSMTAIYSSDGSRICTTTVISEDRLPLFVWEELSITVSPESVLDEIILREAGSEISYHIKIIHDEEIICRTFPVLSNGSLR